MQSRTGFFVIVAALMYSGYRILDNWAIAHFGVVRAWQFKHFLIYDAWRYALFTLVGVAACYYLAKISVKWALVAVVIAALCIGLHGLSVNGYLTVIGWILFYGVTFCLTFWILAMVALGPVGAVMRFWLDGRGKMAEIRSKEADTLTKLTAAKATELQAAHSVHSGQNVVVLDHRTGEIRNYLTPPKSMLIQQEQQPAEEYQSNSVELFADIYNRTQGEQNAPCAVIAGRKRSGKTNFLSELTHRYPEIDWRIVDPKQRDKRVIWGPTVQTYGHGDDWEEVSRLVDFVYAEQRRREKMTDRLDELPKMIVVIDELLTVLNTPSKELGEKFTIFYQTVLTKMSWLGIGVFVLTHSTTATALGFKAGYAQLRDCFDGIFRFKYDIKNDIRQAFFEFDDVEIEIPLYHPMSAAQKRMSAHSARQYERPHGVDKKGSFGGCAECAGVRKYLPGRPKPIEIPISFDNSEQTVVKMKCAGSSNRKIFDALKWPKGGDSNKKVNAILTKFGIRTAG